MIAINPGSGPIARATEDNATANMTAFAEDLLSRGVGDVAFTRRPDADYGDGRYAFSLTMTGGITSEVQMPGLPTDGVRYLAGAGQDPWGFPRLYVDDSSWLWHFALDIISADVVTGGAR